MEAHIQQWGQQEVQRPPPRCQGQKPCRGDIHSPRAVSPGFSSKLVDYPPGQANISKCVPSDNSNLTTKILMGAPQDEDHLHHDSRLKIAIPVHFPSTTTDKSKLGPTKLFDKS